MSPVQAAALGVAETKLREFISVSVAGNQDGQAREKLAEFAAAAHAGGIEPGHALEFLRDVPEIRAHFGRLKSAIDDTRDELVVDRDEAPAEAAPGLEAARSAFLRARAASEKAESDFRAAREAFDRVRDRYSGLDGQLRNQVGNRNITLDLLADPALEQAIAELHAEQQDMHGRAFGTTDAARFRFTPKPDAKLRRRLHDEQRELTAEVRAALDSLGTSCSLPDGGDLQARIEAERGPETRYSLFGIKVAPLLAPGMYGQESSYIEALAWGQVVLRAAKTLNLPSEVALAFVERVKAAIPYRDPTIAFRARGLTLNPPPRREPIS